MHRNFFGRQIASFEQDVPFNFSEKQDNSFPGVFIRAPAILSVQEGVQILGEITHTTGSSNGEPQKVIVAAQQGTLLATVFHPELTSDGRVHKYFVDLVRKHLEA